MSKTGDIIVTSEQHRTQRRNEDEAVAKLTRLVEEAGQGPRAPSQATVRRVKML